MTLTITLDCTVCEKRKLQVIDFEELAKYEPVEERQGRKKRLVYRGVCRVCETKQKEQYLHGLSL